MLWRDPRRAGLLMAASFLISLAVDPSVFLKVGSGPPGLGTHVLGALGSAFFAWRVTRGGRISRMLLVISAEIGFLTTAFEIASRFGPVVFGVLIANAVQIALLLSPAVYQRTRPPDWAGPVGWTRVWPPPALLLLGILAGLVATLLGLAQIDFPASGCYYGDAGRASMTCLTVVDGWPLRWLGGYHSALVVDWAAMAKDLVQCTVIGASVFYCFWLGPRTREEPIRSRAPAAAILGSMLAGLTFAAVTGGFPLTWVTAIQGAPTFSQRALLIDTALWTLVALCGYLAVRPLVRSHGGRRGAVEPVRPADGEE